MTKKTKKVIGISVTVSPAAHAKMREEAYKAAPRRNLRQQINFINNLKLDL